MLFAIALGTALGIGLAPWLAGSPWPLLGLVLLVPLRGRPRLCACFLVALLLSPAAWWAELRAPSPTQGDVAWRAPRRFIRLDGTIAGPPEQHAGKWRAEAVTADGRGRMMVTWPAEKRPSVGDRWAWAGRLNRPEGPRNPGEFDYRAYLARRGIFATMQAEEGRRQGADPTWAWMAAIDRLRMRLLTGLGAGLAPEQAALLGSLVLGGGAAPVDSETAQAFRRVGLAHLLAASGAQVGLLMLLLFRSARALRASAGLAAAWTAPWLLLYLLLTGAPASMGRATLMGLVALLGLALERRSVPFAALYLTAAVMLIAEPACLHDLGFQFSLLATYGLMRLAHRLEKSPLAGPAWLWGFLLVPVVAWAWVTPWQLSIFHTWSWLALPANWLAGFLILALTPLGLGVAATGAVSPGLAGWLNALTGLLLGWLQAMVGSLAAQPHAELSAAGWPWWGLVALYAALWCGLRHRRLALALGMVAAIALIPSPNRAELRLSFLSVGQGDALALRTPGGRWVVVDGGPADDDSDAGAATVLPFLRREGCRRLALLVATHAHQDHVGGLSALVEALPVEQAWDAGQAECSPGQQHLLASWLRHGVPWTVARPGLVWEADGVRLTVLAPGPGRHTVNDGSLVVRVQYGRFSALLTGDAEAASEQAMRGAGRPLRADVLKVGHHGSATSSSPAFLAAVRPRLAVISVGRHNRFKHPAPQTLRRLRHAGAAIARTDLSGAVLIRSDGLNWQVADGTDDWRAWRAPAR